MHSYWHQKTTMADYQFVYVLLVTMCVFLHNL